MEIDSNYIIKRKIITKIQYILSYFHPPAIPFCNKQNNLADTQLT